VPQRPDNRPPDDLVSVLRAEIDGLRAAARRRAVIEQAKGILVEREGISLDEAFGRLRTMSQEHNVRLVEVAATIVGVSLPSSGASGLVISGDVLRHQLPASSSASTTWQALQQEPEVRDGMLSALLDSVAGATSTGEESARLLLDLLEPFHPDALVMYRLTLDGSLGSVGQVGLPGDTSSAWRSIPGNLDVPLTRCVRDDAPYFGLQREARVKDFPVLAGVESIWESTVAIPVHDAGQPIGVVGLMWKAEPDFDGATMSAMTRTVDRVASMLVRQASRADPDLDWLNALLNLHWDPWLLLDAVPGGDGTLRDFIVADASLSAVPTTTDWLGRRIRELWPSLLQDGTWDSLAGLLRYGGTWSGTVGASGDAPWSTPGARVRAVRIGRRVVLVWRLPSELARG
jgi:hypothetical protein